MSDYEDEPTSVQGEQPPLPGRPLSQDQKSAIAAALVGTVGLGGAAYAMSRYMDGDTPTPTAENGTVTGSDIGGAGSGSSSGTGTGGAVGVVGTGGIGTGSILDGIGSGVGTGTGGGIGTGVGTGSGGTGIAGGTGTGSEIADGTIHNIHHTGPLFHNNGDLNGMTFEDAFREARHDMGPGHYFEWNHELYNTFYKDEWERMGPAQHQEFLASVYGDDMPDMQHHNPIAENDIPPVVVPVNEPNDDSDITVDDSTTVEDTSGTVTVDDTHHNDDTHVVTIPEDADVAVIDMDGHEISVFDTDHDNHPDALMGNESHVILIDTDHDQKLDTEAIRDPETHQLSNVHSMDHLVDIDGNMELLHHQDEHMDPMLADNTDEPDLDNNADISDLDYTA